MPSFGTVLLVRGVSRAHLWWGRARPTWSKPAGSAGGVGRLVTCHLWCACGWVWPSRALNVSFMCLCPYFDKRGENGRVALLTVMGRSSVLKVGSPTFSQARNSDFFVAASFDGPIRTSQLPQKSIVVSPPVSASHLLRVSWVAARAHVHSWTLT